MMKVNWLKLAITACALMLAIPLSASSGSTANTDKKMMTTVARRTAWKPETLSGKIMKVDPAHNLVVVETSDGVPFDFVITAKTRIKSGDQGITFKDLTRDMNNAVWVTFTPERRGDVARLIQING